jgi:hypothetical protein
MATYRKVLRSLGSLQRAPRRSSWNFKRKKNPATLNAKAQNFAVSAIRHAFESPPRTKNKSSRNSNPIKNSLLFIDSLKGTSESALHGRIAALNSARILNQLSSRNEQTKNNVGSKLQSFLSDQINLFEPNVGNYYKTNMLRTSTERRAFSTFRSSTISCNNSYKEPKPTQPYVPFGTPVNNAIEDESENEEDYEWTEEVWELRTYDKTGREYLYNRATHEIRPAEEAYDSITETLLPDYTPPTVSVKKRDVDENEDRELRWEEHAEVRGDRFPYYLNRATGECTWQFPFEDPNLVPEYPVIQQYHFMNISDINELPVAPLSKRLGAAAIDFLIAAGATSLYSAVMWYEMGPKCLPGVAILMFVSYSWKDAVLDQGSIGFGKRYMGLEIIKTKDGTLPSRYETVGRSFYFISYYGLLAIGVFEMPELLYAAAGLFTTDIGLMFVKGKRIGDYLFGTKVIEVQDLRKERIQDRVDYLKAEAAAA